MRGLFLALLLSVTTTVIASESIQAEHIHITDMGIFVVMGEEVHEVSSLTYNEDGTYSVGTINWKCPKCGHINKFYHAQCKNPACK